MTDEPIHSEDGRNGSEWDWDAVERLIGDLDRDGYGVDSVRTNHNPVSGDKLVAIEVSYDE